MSPCAHSLDLWGRIRSIPGRAETGRWLTAVPCEEQALSELLDGGLRQGRFNPPHSFPVLYLAADDAQCRSLIQELARQDEGLFSSRVVAVVNVRLSNVLDLGDRGVRRALGVTLCELASTDDMSVTQSLGVAARHAGFEAILYPRLCRPGSRNLAVILDRVTPDELTLAA